MTYTQQLHCNQAYAVQFVWNLPNVTPIPLASGIACLHRPATTATQRQLRARLRGTAWSRWKNSDTITPTVKTFKEHNAPATYYGTLKAAIVMRSYYVADEIMDGFL